MQGKPRIHRLSVELNEDLMKRLMYVAHKEDRPRASVIRRTLEQYLPRITKENEEESTNNPT